MIEIDLLERTTKNPLCLFFRYFATNTYKINFLYPKSELGLVVMGKKVMKHLHHDLVFIPTCAMLGTNRSIGPAAE